MSNYKNKMLYISGELSQEEAIENLNEDHRLVTRNADLEARIHETFAKVMRDIQSMEYSLGGYASLPYGKKDPEEIINQARNNQEMYKKLKSIAYAKMRELKQVVDETFCPSDYEEKRDAYRQKEEQPTMEIEIGTEEKPADADFAPDHTSKMPEKMYSKKTKKKKKKNY